MIMGLAELKADAKLLRERIAATETFNLDAKHELAENIIPLFECLIEALQEGVIAEVEDLGEAFDELVDQSEDVLQQDTAAKFVGVIEIGKLLANELDAVIAKLDDVGKKRVRTLVKAYRQGAEVISEIITEITMVDDDEEEDEEDEPEAVDGDAVAAESATEEG